MCRIVESLCCTLETNITLCYYTLKCYQCWSKCLAQTIRSGDVLRNHCVELPHPEHKDISVSGQKGPGWMEKAESGNTEGCSVYNRDARIPCWGRKEWQGAHPDIYCLLLEEEKNHSLIHPQISTHHCLFYLTKKKERKIRANLRKRIQQFDPP